MSDSNNTLQKAEKWQNLMVSKDGVETDFFGVFKDVFTKTSFSKFQKLQLLLTAFTCFISMQFDSSGLVFDTWEPILGNDYVEAVCNQQILTSNGRLAYSDYWFTNINRFLLTIQILLPFLIDSVFNKNPVHDKLYELISSNTNALKEIFNMKQHLETNKNMASTDPFVEKIGKHIEKSNELYAEIDELKNKKTIRCQSAVIAILVYIFALSITFLVIGQIINEYGIVDHVFHGYPLVCNVQYRTVDNRTVAGIQMTNTESVFIDLKNRTDESNEQGKQQGLRQFSLEITTSNYKDSENKSQSYAIIAVIKRLVIKVIVVIVYLLLTVYCFVASAFIMLRAFFQSKQILEDVLKTHVDLIDQVKGLKDFILDKDDESVA